MRQRLSARDLIKRTTKQFGALLLFLGATMFLCVALSFTALLDDYWQTRQMYAGQLILSCSALVALFGGGLCLWMGRRASLSVGHRDALLIVSCVWIGLIFLGAFPLYIGAGIPFADAIFESTSGWTTTGATVMNDLSSGLSAPLHLWRLMMHWVGGLGIIVIFIALFPTSGTDTRRMVLNETSSASVTRSMPRMRDVTKSITLIYCSLTSMCVLCYCVAGLSLFEAIGHSFSSVGTGGFALHDRSIGHYESASIEAIFIVFMLLGGINFRCYPRFFKVGLRAFWENMEVRLFLFVVLLATLFVAYQVWLGCAVSPAQALRDSSFQVVSMMTTTGFSSADYESWPGASQLLLFCLIFFGGCSGSTAGGMKFVRLLIICQAVLSEVRRGFRPTWVKPIRVEQQKMSHRALLSTLTYIIVFFVAVAVCGLFVATVDDVDMLTALSAALSCVGNIGPGFGLVGPTENYQFLSGASKWMLSIGMLFGRLEFFTVLAILTPSFWRR